MNKPLNILIIEDKEHHIDDAKKYFAPIAQRGIITPTYARTLWEAEQQFSGSPDGIISDIFFPIGKTAEEDAATVSGIAATLRQELEQVIYLHQYEASMNVWMQGESPPPAGIVVAQHALAKKIPFVFNTDTFHHGNATQPIDSWRQQKRLAYVESGLRSVMDESSPHKKWRDAYTVLAGILEGEKYFPTDVLYLPSKIKTPEQEIAEAQKGAAGLPSYAGWTIDHGKKYLGNIKEWLSKIKPVLDKYGIELND